MNLHRGFVEAYLTLRDEIVDVIEDLRGRGADAPPLRLHVTGHSLGGAMAMLCALDLATLSRYGAEPLFSHIQTTTFAAPRVGCATFANLFGRTFPHPSDFLALQAPSDAVPHLPFAAWGFQHPTGTAVLPDRAQLKAMAPRAARSRATPSVVRRCGDPGDSVDALRPKDGHPLSWVTSHDIGYYMTHLDDLLGSQNHSPLALSM